MEDYATIGFGGLFSAPQPASRSIDSPGKFLLFCLTNSTIQTTHYTSYQAHQNLSFASSRSEAIGAQFLKRCGKLRPEAMADCRSWIDQLSKARPPVASRFTPKTDWRPKSTQPSRTLASRTLAEIARVEAGRAGLAGGSGGSNRLGLEPGAGAAICRV